jgi:hypothetical protein
MANDRYAFVRAIDSLPCLAFGVGKRDRITTCNISLDRYLKKEINWREKKKFESTPKILGERTNAKSVLKTWCSETE